MFIASSSEMIPDLFEQLFCLGGHVGGGQAVCLEQLIRLTGLAELILNTHHGEFRAVVARQNL